MTTIQAKLKQLPHAEWADEEWVRSPDTYPVLQRIARALNPRGILEVGTTLGYSLVALLDALPDLAKLVSVDNERAVPHSRSKARDNIEAYLRQHAPDRAASLSAGWAASAGTLRQSDLEGVDLVCLDGDQSQRATLADLKLFDGVAKHATWLLVAGVDHRPEVRQAVDEFAAATGRTSLHIASLRGLVLLHRDAELPAEVIDALMRARGVDVTAIGDAPSPVVAAEAEAVGDTEPTLKRRRVPTGAPETAITVDMSATARPPKVDG